MKCAYQELENVISIGLQKESLYLVLQSDLILANLILAGREQSAIVDVCCYRNYSVAIFQVKIKSI